MPPTCITAYDMVVDGSDNFETRYLLADTCEALEDSIGDGGGWSI
jgi:molybdopterin/thiamine biosynthesis adenylyltransferase